MNNLCHNRVVKLAAIGLLTLASMPSLLRAASFQGLGLLPMPSNLLQSGATAVSFDGTAIVGTVETDTESLAFLWTQNSGVMTPIGVIDPLYPTSRATAVSASGEIVVGQAGSALGPQAFYRTSLGSVVGLGDLAGGQFASDATGISADGQVIVGTGQSTFGSEAFRFDLPAGSLVGLGMLANGISSEALGVSADGNTIVGRSATFSAIEGEAFRWTEGLGMVGLGDLAGGQLKSVAYATSGTGTVIVGSGTTDFGTEAFRWTSGTGMVSLGDLPGGPVESVARAISASGTTIVGEAYTNGANSVAFLWDQPNGMRDLRTVLTSEFGLGDSLTGWDLLAATGISADGRIIAGRGINPNGKFEAWRAELATAVALTADFDLDTDVDGDDLTQWMGDFGGPGSDSDGDGDSDGKDFLDWQKQFTGNLSLQSTLAAVPEPNTSLLLCWMVIWVTNRRIYRVQ